MHAPRIGRRSGWLTLWAGLAVAALTAVADPATSSQPQSGAPASKAAQSPDPGYRPRILTLDVKGPITVATAEFITAGLESGQAQRYDLVLVQLDTPGGALDATREIVQKLLASQVPVAVWVGPAGAQAASAGTFITMAANVAAMSPTSNIGAAHPVTSSGADIKKEAGEDMAKKVENDTAAFARSIAAARDRNGAWAEKAVRESVSITADQAVKLKVVDLTAADVPALLDAIDGRQVKVGAATHTLHTRGAVLEPLRMTIRQRTLSILGDPNLVALLMLIGLGGIALELYHPGSIFPGAVGAFFLLLGLLGTRVIPVNVGGILLLVAGVALLVTEAYVTSHGIAGAAGAVCVGLGTLLFIDKSSPDYQFDPGAFSISPWVVWPTPIVISAMLFYVAYKVVDSRRGKLVAGAPGLVGEIGEALSDVGLEGGDVFVHGEYWRARSTGPIPRGTRVRVVAVEGLVALVVAQGGNSAVQT
jgi:membrane-bound serine protease (ClpP class)